MNNPFDNAYDAVVHREEENRVRGLRRREEAVRQLQYARAVAEPYLLTVAPAVHRRLTELRIDPIRGSSGAQLYWPLGATFNGTDGKISVMGGRMLCITDDGVFVRDPSLPSREGFEDLLNSLYVIRQGARYGDVVRESPVCVEDDSGRVCVATHGYEDAIVSEFSEHIAEQVRLLHRASLSGPIWQG